MQKKLSVQRLAEISKWRAVELLPNSHIAFHWDLTTFELRTADLIVLHQCLLDWFDQPQTNADHLVIHMGKHDLPLAYRDFVELCDLLSDATKQLPRQVVRWVDNSFTVSILDHRFLPTSKISFN